MNEKQFARLKQLCAETGTGDYSTDEEWTELALYLTHDMVAEIVRLREALSIAGHYLKSMDFEDEKLVREAMKGGEE